MTYDRGMIGSNLPGRLSCTHTVTGQSNWYGWFLLIVLAENVSPLSPGLNKKLVFFGFQWF